MDDQDDQIKHTVELLLVRNKLIALMEKAKDNLLDVHGYIEEILEQSIEALENNDIEESSRLVDESFDQLDKEYPYAKIK